MAVATLQYTHVCAGATKEPNEEEIQKRLQMAKNRAIAGFLQRHGAQEDSDPNTREAKCSDTELGGRGLEV